MSALILRMASEIWANSLISTYKYLLTQLETCELFLLYSSSGKFVFLFYQVLLSFPLR